jgi:uncharacterized protein YjbI with pentapeptide repeats
MANPEHLAILKQGVEIWNNWIDQNPDVIPDLYKADMRDTNLRGADLCSANLGEANLIKTNLGEAQLSHADLRGANLREADLRKANLIEANLRGANLLGTDLREADLSGVNLLGADLSKADLSKSDLIGANLSWANLTEAKLVEAHLFYSQVISATFNNATLTGACIKNWQINSETNLDGVICEYVYLDEIDDEKTERRPTKGNFAPGEFTSLYKKILENTDLILREILENENTLNKPEKKIDVDNTSNNQGVQFRLDRKIYTWERLRFRSKTEIKIAEALDRTGILFVPNSLARLNTPKGRENKEADFLICYNGKWGVLEVDGPFHTPERRVEEQERERIFKINGIKVVERFDAKECYETPDKVVQKFFYLMEIAYS